MRFLAVLPLFKCMFNLSIHHQSRLVDIIGEKMRHTTVRIKITILSGTSRSAAILEVVSASKFDLDDGENHTASMMSIIR